MSSRIVKCVTLGLMLVLGATTAQANIIPVNLIFSDSRWSGTASFDDTTGQPLTINPNFTTYLIDSMTITFDGVATWDESEIEAPWVPPTGGMLLDSLGTAALLLSAVDTVTGKRIDANIDQGDGTMIASSSFLLQVDPSAFFYTARVPIPATLTLISIGLAGLGWSRRKKV